MSQVTKQEIAENIETLNNLIEKENERAVEIFRTKILTEGTGNWKVYMKAGLSNSDTTKGPVGPFVKIREYKKEIKDWQAKDPEIAKAEKKRKLQEKLAALEAEDAAE